ATLRLPAVSLQLEDDSGARTAGRGRAGGREAERARAVAATRDLHPLERRARAGRAGADAEIERARAVHRGDAVGVAGRIAVLTRPRPPVDDVLGEDPRECDQAFRRRA